ncbi:MAG: hypothetical protein VXU42_03860, partial [Verrucomicrobiota bacterium]|nr:hypothetical protein [Verrucomicrobiota bacterium]
MPFLLLLCLKNLHLQVQIIRLMSMSDPEPSALLDPESRAYVQSPARAKMWQTGTNSTVAIAS